MSLFDELLARKLSGGGVSSWNDLTDKPFGSFPTGGDTLTWDGNTEGLAYFNGLYKVSDVTPTMADFASGAFVTLPGESLEVPYDWLVDTGTMIIFEVFMVVYGDLPGPKGTYFFKESDGNFLSSLTIPGYTGFPSVKTLDAKYLPMADIIAAVQAAMESTEESTT